MYREAMDSTPPHGSVINREYRIKSDNGHQLYVAEAGNMDGIPAVFLHGGPGSGCQPAHAELFELDRFRIVLPDQRGAGRSTPKGSLAANTTQHLIADLELIREHLGINRWILVGGSWGATLAIAYAEAYPNRVGGAALRAIFLGTSHEVHWALVEGPQILRPDLWQSLVALLPPQERNDPFTALSTRVSNPDPAIHVPAACVWGDFERTLSEIAPTSANLLPASLSTVAEGRAIPSTPYIENHYFRHSCFLEPGQLLRDAGLLAGIPAVLVQGRYDLLCPPRNAAALAAAWQGCDLRIIEGAGHAATDPGIRPALKAAISELADLKA